jgi:hypothetical protein
LAASIRVERLEAPIREERLVSLLVTVTENRNRNTAYPHNSCDRFSTL